MYNIEFNAILTKLKTVRGHSSGDTIVHGLQLSQCCITSYWSDAKTGSRLFFARRELCSPTVKLVCSRKAFSVNVSAFVFNSLLYNCRSAPTLSSLKQF